MGDGCPVNKHIHEQGRGWGGGGSCSSKQSRTHQQSNSENCRGVHLHECDGMFQLVAKPLINEPLTMKHEYNG